MSPKERFAASACNTIEVVTEKKIKYTMRKKTNNMKTPLIYRERTPFSYILYTVYEYIQSRQSKVMTKLLKSIY